MAKTTRKPREPNKADAPTAPTPSVPTFTPERVAELLGLPAALAPPPPPRDRDGFVTLWDPGVSIETLRLQVAARRPAVFYPAPWADGPFARDRGRPGWRHVRTHLAPDSLGRPVRDLLALAPLNEEVPTARLVTTCLVLVRLATDTWLYGDRRVLTASRSPTDRLVQIGGSAEWGILFSWGGDEYASPALGVATALVPPPVRV